jgi:tetratricopeptide (TPR) repeat protein
LEQLIDKSMVIVRAGSEDSETRYGMLETIREYGREKLDESGETERLRHRHRDFFIVLAEQAEPELRRTEQIVWLDRLDGEYDNLRAAWDSAIENDANLASRLASALLDFWMMRGNVSEGRQWLAKLLERTNNWGPTVTHAHLLGTAGRLAQSHQDYVSARTLLEETLSIARISGDKSEIASALLWLGRVAGVQRDDQIAQSCLEECWTIYKELQDPWGIALARLELAVWAAYHGHYVEAEEHLMTSLTLLQELGDKFRVGFVLNSLGELARLQGNYEQAGKFYEEDIAILRKQRIRFPLADPLFNLAWVSLQRDDYQKAKDLFEESLKLFIEVANETGMMDCLLGFATVMGMTGKLYQAAQLFGAAESLLEVIARHMDPSDQKEFDHYVAVVRGQLDQETFAKAWAEGRAMTLEQAIELALRETKE